VNGDGKNEVVIMDNHNLYVLKYDGNKLGLLQKIECGVENNFLSLDVADVNRNGVAEIIVTSIVDDKLRSFILEYAQGKFKKVVEDADFYFRVLELPKEGPILMGQRMSNIIAESGSAFSGPVYRFVWKKNSFERGPKMPFPRGTKIFGLAMGDIRGQGRQELIGIDRSGQLTITTSDKDRKPSWASPERYGGTINFYDNVAKRKLWDGGKLPAASDWRVFIPGRILIRDLDGDGLNEVIVNKNISSTLVDFIEIEKLKRYEKGEIYDLVWNEGELMTNWKTKETHGYIADFQIKDVDNDGNEELVVAVIDLGDVLTMKGTSNLLFFKLP
jgi:hypothetical protein